MSVGAQSVWRARAVLFVVLGLLIAGNVAILISHSVFYEVRLLRLQETRHELETRRDEARGAARKVADDERRLRSLREGLEKFYAETLGARNERLAPLIEGVYAITRRAGFATDSVSFAEEPVPGADHLTLTFSVSGSYGSIKRLLAAFENDPGFLVLERVAVATDEQSPDLLKVGLTVSHFFRAEGAPTARRARREAR